MSSIQLIIYLIIIINIIIPTLCSSSSTVTPMNIDVANGTIEDRIIGGKPAKMQNMPFMVSIQRRHQFSHHCGGSYIKPSYVLTAAHCLIRSTGRASYVTDNHSGFVAVAGTQNLIHSPTWQIRHIESFLPHPNFTLIPMACDIGIIKLLKPFRLTRYVNLVPFPSVFNKKLHRLPKTCIVAGWGRTNNRGDPLILRQAHVPLLKEDLCLELLHDLNAPEQICAGKLEGGVDACQGDSGGPLMCDDIQVGIVSWGYGCARPKSPGAYTRIDLYLNWIHKHGTQRSSGSKQLFSDILILFIIYHLMFN